MTRVPEPFEGRLVAPGGVPLSVTHWRPAGHARGSLVLVHGWGEHRHRYVELAQAMNEHELSVWGYDLRGHGTSGGRRGHARRFDDLVDDLAWVVEHVRTFGKPEMPLLLLGHSMGGLVVLRALQTGAVAPRAACVSAPWLATAVPVPAWKRQLARILNRVLPSLPIPNPLDPTTRTRDEGKIRDVRADPLVHGWMTPRLFMEVQRAQAAALDAPSALDLPVLFIIPGDDPVVDANVTAHFVRRSGGSQASVVDAPSSRHEPFNEVDRRTRFDEVGRFFTGVLDDV